MNKRTLKRLLLLIKILLGGLVAFTLLALIAKYAPWIILVIVVSPLLWMVWDLTEDLVD